MKRNEKIIGHLNTQLAEDLAGRAGLHRGSSQPERR